MRFAIHFRNSFFIVALTLLANVVMLPQPALAVQTVQEQERDLEKVKSVVNEAFATTHDGWSSDEVILRDDLNASFIAACESELPAIDASVLNWTLLNLRKAGKLTAKSTKRTATRVEPVSHIAEIVSRSLQDKHKVSSDRLMCDPQMRAEFDELAASIAPDVDLYSVRKAAFKLRKTRRLKPELITRIADWGRTVTEYSAESLRDQPDLAQEHPGVYIFRDSTGYLYIGQTENLRERMISHLDESHNESLANYLKANDCQDITIEIHDFDPESQANQTMVRRAYESELIASRKPRFNIQP